jgi:hypothetical protein
VQPRLDTIGALDPQLAKQTKRMLTCRSLGHTSSFELAAAAAALALLGAAGVTLYDSEQARLQDALGTAPEPSATRAARLTQSGSASTATQPREAHELPESASAAGPPGFAEPEPALPGPSAPIGRPLAEPDPGRYQPPEVVRDGVPRVYPMTRNVWVRPGPSHALSWIGFSWFGSSMRRRAAPALPGPGCRGLFYPVEPRGYVCVDDERATLDPEHPVLRGVARYAPNLASPWPHRYGESLGLQRYVSLPSERLLRATEPDYEQHRGLLARARAGEPIAALLGVDTSASSGDAIELPILPRTLQTDTRWLGPRSTVAWTREQASGERSFLLASDLKWIAKDRVKPYPAVTFAGVRLGRDARLPLAFFRSRDRPAFTRSDAEFLPSEQVFQRLSWVELTGRRERRGGQVFLETRRAGLFVRESDAVVPAPTPPADAARAHSRRAPATWIEVSILGGWLLAYEGQTPVFATLVSGGRGGVAEPGDDAVSLAATPMGRFSITGKFATATMVADNGLTHSEVPWAQNFSGPHALHGAYWHDRWGELMSGGCINLSPRDARWLLHEFTEPRLPEGWYGVRWLPELGPATTLVVHR